MTTWVKVCGLTRIADAEACVQAGADAIGLNFWPHSSRFVAEARAREIVQAVGARLQVVGVFVDATPEQVRTLQRDVGFDWAQLHGDETPEQLAELLPTAFKALRVAGSEVHQQAARYGGERILLDAYVPGQVGGTGAIFEWGLAQEMARHREVIVAGGLTPANVAGAVRAVRPFGVDTASGVETAPGLKDHELIQRFVSEAKRTPPA